MRGTAVADRTDRAPIDRPAHNGGEAGDARASAAHEKPGFKAYLLGSPKVDDFVVERDRDPGRDIEADDAPPVQP